MVDSWHVLLTLAIAQILIAISPGSNTVLVIQSALHSRKLGFAATAGIWPAGLSGAIVSLCGLGALMKLVPELAIALHLICGAYLIYLGVKIIRASFARGDHALNVPAKELSVQETFRAGIISNLTNPKGIAYINQCISKNIFRRRNGGLVFGRMTEFYPGSFADCA